MNSEFGFKITMKASQLITTVVATESRCPLGHTRHTAASLAIASRADVKVVQQMLGHKSATMTLDLYGHLFPDRLDEVADALDAAARAAAVARLLHRSTVVDLDAKRQEATSQ